MEKRAVKFGLRIKILSVCLLFLLLNSALVGVLCFHYVTRDTVANFVQSSNDLLSQINSHLNDEMRGISQKVAAINANSSIYQTLHRAVRNGDSAAYAALLSDMADVITEFQNSDDFVSSMYVYTPLGSFESFTHIRRQDFDFPSSVLYEKFAAAPTTYVAWYPAMESPVFRDTETVIPVVYKVRMDGAYGYFIVSLYQKRIQEYLDKTYYSYDYLFILDADGQPITLSTDQITADGWGNLYTLDGAYQGQLGVFTFADNAQLTKGESGLFQANGQQAQVQAQPEVMWKHVEESNVDMLQEMSRMLTAQRSLQSGTQVLKLYNEMLTKATSQIGQM